MIRKLNAAFREAGMAYKLVDYGLSHWSGRRGVWFSPTKTRWSKFWATLTRLYERALPGRATSGLAPCGQLTVTEIKGRGSLRRIVVVRTRTSRPLPFQQRQTPLGDLLPIPTAVSRRLFRCLGHTSSEALRM